MQNKKEPKTIPIHKKAEKNPMNNGVNNTVAPPAFVPAKFSSGKKKFSL